LLSPFPHSRFLELKVYLHPDGFGLLSGCAGFGVLQSRLPCAVFCCLMVAYRNGNRGLLLTLRNLFASAELFAATDRPSFCDRLACAMVVANSSRFSILLPEFQSCPADQRHEPSPRCLVRDKQCRRRSHSCDALKDDKRFEVCAVAFDVPEIVCRWGELAN